MATSANSQYLSLKEEYFDSLCLRLGLEDRHLESDVNFGFASARRGSVRVFFEHERGLCAFSLGVPDAKRPLCSVETIAGYFPRVRLLAEGGQRLSLEEQSAMIERYWVEMQRMFSADGIAETTRWLADLSAAITAKYSGRS
jgi:hypothetical protein